MPGQLMSEPSRNGEAADCIEAQAAEIARLKAQAENMIGALMVIMKSAEQSGNWPPHRVYASTEGIEKVAIRALIGDLDGPRSALTEWKALTND